MKPEPVMQIGDVFRLGDEPDSWLVVMMTSLVFGLVRMRTGESPDECNERFLFDDYGGESEYRTLPRVAVEHAVRLQ